MSYNHPTGMNKSNAKKRVKLDFFKRCAKMGQGSFTGDAEQVHSSGNDFQKCWLSALCCAESILYYLKIAGRQINNKYGKTDKRFYEDKKIMIQKATQCGF